MPPAQSTPLTRPDGTTLRIPTVDGEPSLTKLLAMTMRYEGWKATAATTGISTVRAARVVKPDVIMLDIMLPDFDGLEMMCRIHVEQPDVPAISLTAKDGVADRTTGLTAGGNDYVTKPFSLEEVIAWLRGPLCRSSAMTMQPDTQLVVGNPILNEDSCEVIRASENINLTATEFELLRCLMCNPERVLSKAQILDRVWNYNFGGQTNVVELYISYLRKKTDTGRPPMIHAMRGVGYVLRPASS